MRTIKKEVLMTAICTKITGFAKYSTFLKQPFFELMVSFYAIIDNEIYDANSDQLL